MDRYWLQCHTNTVNVTIHLDMLWRVIKAKIRYPIHNFNLVIFTNLIVVFKTLLVVFKTLLVVFKTLIVVFKNLLVIFTNRYMIFTNSFSQITCSFSQIATRFSVSLSTRSPIWQTRTGSPSTLASGEESWNLKMQLVKLSGVIFHLHDEVTDHSVRESKHVDPEVII